MSLPKSDPTSYDNNSILMQNLLKNKQRALCDKVESRGIVYQLLAHFLTRAQAKMETKANRIEKAQLILITDETPVKNVAFSLSYDDYSYFNRLFKKTTRLTPQEYRNSYH